MLNDRLQDGFERSLGDLSAQPGVELLTEHRHPQTDGFRHVPAVLSVDGATVAARAEVREEAFGPAVLLARYANERDLHEALDAFEGQLAAWLFAEPGEDADLIAALSQRLAGRVGRIVFDGFPTGVAVTWAMQHGGPYPATTAPGHTSVGLTSTRRFMRPVCWQSAPQSALPAALRDANPSGIWRRINGRLTTESVAA
jgi:NADP-dependent aldehyde dehydrogenase